MANTVNDVMNVIASPDYGIKNIAGTNQEILAILMGVHNSKNNIHSIVDDVRNLLQNLVDMSKESSKKKNVEIGGGKLAKINNKHITSILSETKSIKSSIDKLASIMSKQAKIPASGVVKLSNKASEKVANAMIKSMSKQNKGGAISAFIDSFAKLKDISLKDLLFGKKKIKLITKIFKDANKDLKINKKDLENIIKLINSAPDIVKALMKINWRIKIIIKSDTIKKLSDILVGKKSILTLSRDLRKNKKIFQDGKQVAKNITALIGNLLLTTIFLTIAAVTGLPAILGIKLLSKIVNKLIDVSKKLSKNKKHISKAIGSAITLTAFTGLLAITSLFLATVAITGIPALLGSILILGIVAINIFTCKFISKSMSTIVKGSIGMAIMGLSLLLFGYALDKITTATKDVDFKQVAIIASITLLLGVCVAIIGFPAIFNYILLGSIGMLIMGVALIPFGFALNQITKATKDVDFKQVAIIASLTVVLGGSIALMGVIFPLIMLGSIGMLIMGVALIPFGMSLKLLTKATRKMKLSDILSISGAMLALGGAVSLMAFMFPLVVAGAATLGAMSVALLIFSSAIKSLSEAGAPPMDLVEQSIDAMSEIGMFFSTMSLNLKAVLNAKMYLKLMRPFGRAINHLAKLKEIGDVPLNLVTQTLDAIDTIAKFYSENPLDGDAEDNADDYLDMLKPFGRALRHLAKLKEMGDVPLNLITQTLDAIDAIGKYYLNNPIDGDAEDNAEDYLDILEPFGDTITYLVELKNMEDIPLSMIQDTLDSMHTIANYYLNHPIDGDAEDNAEDFLDITEPFRETVASLVELKKMENLPRTLISDTLDAMSSIATYYLNHPIDGDAEDNAEDYLAILEPFGNTVSNLVALKKMENLPKSLVWDTLDAMRSIANYYLNNPIDDDAEDNAEDYLDIMEPFSLTITLLSKLKKMSQIPKDTVKDTLVVMYLISDFYKRITFKGIFGSSLTANFVTNSVKSFCKSVNDLKEIEGFESIPVESIKDVISAMLSISFFYKNVSFSKNIRLKSILTEYIVDKFTTMVKNIQDKFNDIKPIDYNAVNSIVESCHEIISFYGNTIFFIKMQKIINMNDSIKLFVGTANYLSDNLKAFSRETYGGVNNATKSMKNILRFLSRNTLNKRQRKQARKNLTILEKMAFAMSSISKITPSNISDIGNALMTTIGEVESIDITKVQAVTNLFNAFNEINKSENIINKFTDSVNKFTNACQKLMVIMNENTNAINKGNSFKFDRFKLFGDKNDDTENSSVEIYGGEQSNEVRITNVDEIARRIADRINGSLSVDMADTQIQLLINGTGGNEWTITKY